MADAGPDADVGSGAGSGVRLPHFLEDTWNKIELNLSKPYENVYINFKSKFKVSEANISDW